MVSYGYNGVIVTHAVLVATVSQMRGLLCGTSQLVGEK